MLIWPNYVPTKTHCRPSPPSQFHCMEQRWEGWISSFCIIISHVFLESQHIFSCRTQNQWLLEQWKDNLDEFYFLSVVFEQSMYNADIETDIWSFIQKPQKKLQMLNVTFCSALYLRDVAKSPPGYFGLRWQGADRVVTLTFLCSLFQRKSRWENNIV